MPKTKDWNNLQPDFDDSLDGVNDVPDRLTPDTELGIPLATGSYTELHAVTTKAAEHSRRTNNGLVLALIAQTGKFLLGFGGMLVFARTVTPQDFGLFSIALAVFSFGSLFKDGLSLAVVQRDELTPEQSNTTYWIAVLIGVVVSLLTVIAAPVFAAIYKAPILLPLLLGLAAAQMLVFLGSFQVALLRRKMLFGTLGAIEQIATFIAMGLGIVIALKGGGIWSLFVAQSLVAVCTAFGATLRCGWRPGKFQIKSDSFAILAYGKRVTASDIATYITRNLDNLLIGWYCGTSQLGFYDRAYTMMQLPMVQLLAPIGGVAHSSLSKTAGHEDLYRKDAKNVLSLIACVGMFASAFLFLNADTLIPVVLGKRWLPSVPILQSLAPSAYIDAGVMGVCMLLLTSARTMEYLKMKILAAFVGVGAVFVGIGGGPAGVAAAFSASRLFVFGYGLYLCSTTTVVPWQTFCRAMRPALLASISAVLTVHGVRALDLVAKLGQLEILILSSVLYFATFAAVWCLDPDGRERVGALFRYIQIRRAPKPPASNP